MARAAGVLMAVLALLVAGCGGDEPLSKSDYEREVVEFSTTLREALMPVSADLTGATDLDLIASRLDDGAQVLDDAADDFDELTPPEDIEGAHSQIIGGVRSIADTFRTGADQAQEGNRDRLFATLQAYGESAGPMAIAAAQAELREKGYRGTE